MSTVRGTTPVYTFHIEEIDISGNTVFLTIHQDDFRKTWCNKTEKEVFRVTSENGNTTLTCYEVTVVKRRLQESFISRHVTFVFS